VGTHKYEGDIIGIRLNGTVDAREFTSEHPIWRRRVVRPVSNGKRRTLSEPEFVRANDIRIGDRIGFPIDPEIPGRAKEFVKSFGDPQLVTKEGAHNRSHVAKVSRIIDLNRFAESQHLWFLLGAYIGDGYRRHDRYEVCFCVGAKDGLLADQIRVSLKELGINSNEDNNGGRSNIKIRVESKHLWQLVGAFGDGAENKDIPVSLMNLEKLLLVALIDGYRATDGSEQGRRFVKNELQARWKIPSISLPLLRSLQRLLLRTGQYGGINKCWPGGEHVIEGRTVQTEPRWELIVRMDPKKRTIFEIIDGAIWVRVRKITKRSEIEQVWNLEVDEDNTFCTWLMATHNCKGFSGLLPQATAAMDKYQALNRLVIRGIFLALEAFREDLPAVILLENVPRIRTRGQKLLNTIKGMLQSYGYVVDDRDHDCGEIGGLAQHRKRYLLIARNAAKMDSFIYQPTKQRVKSIGEVIGPLPLPGVKSMGPLHRLPKLQWKTWVRLALIPAGGDWRDLEKIAPEEYLLEHIPRGGGSFGVQEWDKPGHTVTGRAKANGSTASNIADPRLTERAGRHPGVYRVVKFDEPAPCVTGTRFGSGALAISDPRTGFKGSTHTAIYQVNKWDQEAATVTGAHRPNNGAISIADPRVSGGYSNKRKVLEWGQPASTVTGTPDIQSGAQSVADPRLGCKPRSGMMGVQGWDEPGKTVIGSGDIHSGAMAIADPRISHNSRPNLYGVAEWDEPTSTVTGSASVTSSNAVAAVADPRIPKDNETLDPPPIIISLDGTWHRPLTTLELAALQGLPVIINGKPLLLSGNSDQRWREAIGNMVPPPAARAMAEVVLHALLVASENAWEMSANDIWVSPKTWEEIRILSEQ
jgi:Site-specific DNA methylase